MLDKKQEYLAEALDEIRDEYIDEAVTYEAKKKRNWKYWATPVAACLVLVVAIGMGVRYAPIDLGYGFGGAAGNSAAPSDGIGQVSDEMTGSASGSADGKDSASPGDSLPEAGTEADLEGAIENVGSVDPESSQQEVGQSGSSLMWYDPEEIVAQDIAIFRGTVESIVQVEGTPLEGENGSTSWTQVTVLVTECLKGDLEEGESCVIKVPVKIDYQSYYDDYYKDLTRLNEGCEAIFMPRVGDPYYFHEGRRYLFLETMEGVSYAEEVYEIPSEGAVTLDDVEAYLRDLLQ